MAASTEENRRRSIAQGLATTRIEGHLPSPEFSTDCESFIRGEITHEDVRARSLARALEADSATTALARAPQ